MVFPILNILRLIINPQRPLTLNGFKYPIYSLNKNDSRNDLCRRYYPNIISCPSISLISWHDIVFRKVRFSSFPLRTKLKNKSDRLKRIVAKCLSLGIGFDLSLCNFQENLFLLRDKKIIFSSTSNVRNIYQFHNSKFSCYILKDEISFLRIFPFILISKIHRSLLTDNSFGTTIFTNTPNEWIIRIYRMIHPNKDIILRYHDRIENICGKSTSKEYVLQMVKRLRRDLIINSVESYSRKDAKLLDAAYRPNSIDPQKLKNIQTNYSCYLYFFKGAPGSDKGTNSNRSLSIDKLNKMVLEYYPGAEKWICADIVPAGGFRIPYEEYLTLVAQSEVAIDFYRLSPDEGYSFRLAEALWLNKKIITDRVCIKNELFYSPERFFIINYDSPLRFKEFLSVSISPLPLKILNEFRSSF